ncbi:two-component system, chemotaxis family, response regulator CheB [Propionispira arboris]|uniref:Protein-glutamate methylesterase/protein-glutamine glutaminase n=1 Tax=Propionispira arboris TaxID=84035 RepID=A0A1H6V350_9FIRM|nr:chemotaxis response regulator protein-glutamate methylesterase [Propionispira arboris]SEI94682.1 two-component system, chemotaxis family, response regulator CheB [Propionispira arboris]
MISLSKIKVLVVDDSLFFREMLARGLAADAQIEIVATAADPFEARDKILKYHPDVMTLDIEMPKMNGIEFLRKLMPQYPIPTIVISAANNCVFEAISLGAIDFVKKPDEQSAVARREFLDDLIFKVKTAVAAKIQAMSPIAHHAVNNDHAIRLETQLIAIGASTGGTVALTNLLLSLEPPLPGIVVVQHIPPIFSDMFAKRLDLVTKFHVKEAATGDRILPGDVLIAPGDQQMKVKKIGSIYKIECSFGEKVNGHCPSVDVLFNSVAKFGDSVIGIIMTGMGFDGAKGLLSMRKAGAHTIGQDEKTSVVYGMPKVAFNIGAVETQLPLDQIGKKICSLI